MTDMIGWDGRLVRFPKVPNLYNVSPGDGIWAAKEVAVQEKLHGTQGRILVTADDILCGTRRVVMSPKPGGNKGFDGQYDKQMEIGEKVRFGIDPDFLSGHSVQLFGEYVGPGVQKGIYYGDEKDFYVFDIVVIPVGTKEVIWLPVKEVESTCDMLEIKCVPTLYVGSPDIDMFNTQYEAQSVVAECDEDNIVEGVVIKSTPVEFDRYGYIMYAKHKNSKWSEKAMTKKQKTRKVYDNSVAQFVTKARLIHAIERLREDGNFAGEMCDMQYLPKMVIDDIIEEESIDVPDKDTMRNINKTATRVIARMYRGMLEEGI